MRKTIKQPPSRKPPPKPVKPVKKPQPKPSMLNNASFN